MQAENQNVYEFRNAPLQDPKARERVVWIIFGGGGIVMIVVAAVLALTADGGITEGIKKSLVFLILGAVIALLPFGFRHGIRSQNARREAFAIEITKGGVLRLSSLENVGGRTEKPRLEQRIEEVPLREVTRIDFEKDVQSTPAGATRIRSVDYFIRLTGVDGEDRLVGLPPDALGQATALPDEEQVRLRAAAAPFMTQT